jgi:hypothetical protein
VLNAFACLQLRIDLGRRGSCKVSLLASSARGGLRLFPDVGELTSRRGSISGRLSRVAIISLRQWVALSCFGAASWGRARTAVEPGSPRLGFRLVEARALASFRLVHCVVVGVKRGLGEWTRSQEGQSELQIRSFAMRIRWRQRVAEILKSPANSGSLRWSDRGAIRIEC